MSPPSQDKYFGLCQQNRLLWNYLELYNLQIEYSGHQLKGTISSQLKPTKIQRLKIDFRNPPSSLPPPSPSHTVLDQFEKSEKLGEIPTMKILLLTI